MSRLSEIRAAFPDNADALYLTSDISCHYVTGFKRLDGYVIITRDAAMAFTDSRYIEAARAEVDAEFEVVLTRGTRRAMLAEVFKKHNIHTLMIEKSRTSVSAYEAMKADHPSVEIVDSGSIIEKMREFKSLNELGNVKKAQSIAEAAFDHILGWITPERTEVETALELEFFMRSHGAQAASFDIIAVSGTNSSRPHGVPRDIKLQPGFLTMDFGALVDGYCSDMTRTVSIGPATDEMKKVYNTVLEAQLAALEAIAVNKKCADIDKVARDIIADAGYGECFGHSLGHGVGLEIHENPRLASTSAAVLTPGQIVTVEPGIYIEGKFGVRIEDMVYIGKEKCENLTHSPKQLIEI